jgi:hypothetical protein
MAGAARQPQRTSAPSGGSDHEPMGEPITDLTDDDIPF